MLRVSISVSFMVKSPDLISAGDYSLEEGGHWTIMEVISL